MIAAVDDFYRCHNANVARAVHTLGEEATSAYEATRDKLARFLNAPSRDEIVFTSGTTQAINGRLQLRPAASGAGRRIVVTRWSTTPTSCPGSWCASAAGRSSGRAPITPQGELIEEAFVGLLGPRVKLAAVTHVSNVIGTVNLIARLARGAAAAASRCWWMARRPARTWWWTMRALGCDFYAMTGHKLFGPTGTGALWARREHLQACRPSSVAADDPHGELRENHLRRPAAQVRGGHAEHRRLRRSGCGAGLRRGGRARAHRRLRARTAGLCHGGLAERAGAAPDRRGAGQRPQCCPSSSRARTHDLATLLDHEGVAVRSGHHCAHPLMQFYGVPPRCAPRSPSTTRARNVDRFVVARWKRCVRCWRERAKPPCPPRAQNPAMTASDLYQQRVLDHQRAPRHYGALAAATHRADRENALVATNCTTTYAWPTAHRRAGLHRSGLRHHQRRRRRCWRAGRRRMDVAALTRLEALLFAILRGDAEGGSDAGDSSPWPNCGATRRAGSAPCCLRRPAGGAGGASTATTARIPHERSSISFRAAGAADLAAVVAPIGVGLSRGNGRRGWTTEADLLDGQRTDADSVRSLIDAADSRVLLAERGGALLACCHIARERGEDGAPVGYFGMFAVVPDGQGGGIGKEPCWPKPSASRDGWLGLRAHGDDRDRRARRVDRLVRAAATAVPGSPSRFPTVMSASACPARRPAPSKSWSNPCAEEPP